MLINVNTTHKYVLRLSTRRAELPIILRLVHFKMYLRGEKMRAAFLVGCAALLLSACSSNDEPVQQATAAHVSPGMRAAMSSSGQANCAMVGGSLSVARQLDGSAIGMRSAASPCRACGSSPALQPSARRQRLCPCR